MTGDFDTSPDIGVVCAGIERGVADLLETTLPEPDPEAEERDAVSVVEPAVADAKVSREQVSGETEG